MTQTKTTRECSCGCRTCRVVHLIIWLSIFVQYLFGCEYSGPNIFVIIVFPYTRDTGAVTGTEPGDEFYTLPLIEINIAAFQPFNTALFKTNFNFMFFLNNSLVSKVITILKVSKVFFPFSQYNN